MFSNNALKILEKRYLRKNEKGEVVETPEELLRRVADFIGNDDEEREEFFHIMKQKQFLPHSPTIMNAGTTWGTLSACFLLGIEDDMTSIFNTVRDTALIHQQGGGTGFNFSKLRPKNSIVKSSGGQASGPISFMSVFDAATQVVSQGGKRRGANIGLLSIDHPDIEEFIECKSNTKMFNNFNISVILTDEFMSALEKDEWFWLRFNGKKVKKLKAKTLYDKIIYQMWKSGEPGIFFIDTYNKHNMSGELVSGCNPCISGDCRISVKGYGLIKVKDLFSLQESGFILKGCDVTDRVEKMFDVGGCKIFNSGIKQLVSIKLDTGQELFLTEEHKCITQNRGKVVVKDLVIGDKFFVQDNEGFFGDLYIEEDLSFLVGWFLGDGWYSSDSVGITFGKNKIDYLDMLLSILRKYSGTKGCISVKDRVTQVGFESKAIRKVFDDLGFINGIKSYQKRIPDKFFRAKKESVIRLLDGMFSTDGTINIAKNNRDLRYGSISYGLLEDLQLLLYNLGIKSSIYNRPHKNRTHSFSYQRKNGEVVNYVERPYYELIIKGNNILKFKEEIKITHKEKQEKLNRIAYQGKKKEYFLASVKEIKYLDKYEDVYDINQPLTNNLIVNGSVIANCGELGLEEYGSCNLGSINVSMFYDTVDGVKIMQSGEEYITKKNSPMSYINKFELEKVIRLSVRFLDNVIDKNEYPLERIEETTKKWRRIGLGIMGWADLLVKLEIKYDSQEHLDFIDEFMSFFEEVVDSESRNIAEEKGAFPGWAESKYYDLYKEELENPIDDIDLKTQESVAKNKYSYRNVSRTTVAPTGTISALLDCSNGIEPHFSKKALKVCLDNTEFHYEQEDSEFLRTALEISPEWHIKVQAQFQKYIDSSISKTINSVNDMKVEEIENTIIQAYKLGCKGFTYYRDRSREEQVFYDKDRTVIDKPKEVVIEAGKDKKKDRERPEILSGKTIRTKIPCGSQLFITINEDEYGIREVFCSGGKTGGCISSHLDTLGKIVSKFLKNDGEVSELIKDLRGIKCGIQDTIISKKKVTSCADAMALALKEYLETRGEAVEEEKIKGGLCPECGSTLIYQGGCASCEYCGYNKCG